MIRTCLSSRYFCITLIAGSLPILLGQGCPSPQGPAGPAGADGQLRIYGDGSAGDVNITGAVTLFEAVPSGNLQFRNLTIEEGATLTVPSGTVLRCSEVFTNNGTVIVGYGTFGNVRDSQPLGIAHKQAGSHFGGLGISSDEARVLLNADSIGGGAGSESVGVEEAPVPGSNGGGRLLVLAGEAIINAGFLRAEGASATEHGVGGGGGGIIIVASPGSIQNTGKASVRGGGGGSAFVNSFTLETAAGGGGGGIVHFLSPVIGAPDATIDVSGGSGGGPVINVSRENHYNGGGGGASGGNGGDSGEEGTGNVGHDGGPGYFFQTLADPTALFW